MEDGEWTLFSPNDVPELHELHGQAFEAKYTEYEAKVARGELKLFKHVRAKDLWRKMLTMLFETGHPWITFKDPCNIRSPQQHAGVVHSSNLCTEITLNTSDDETAVCNIGSVNLVNHLKDGKLDMPKLQATVTVAMRMLDNVIDLNYYTVERARRGNLKHRPVGIGMMGFHDCLQELRIPYASQAAVEFADQSSEAVCYFAYLASSNLAVERGRYSSFDGSLWSQGILPQDTVAMLAKERGGNLEVDSSSMLGADVWEELRQRIVKQGMRNSNCVAIAPTATIGNIVGVSASIDPIFTNLSVKSNMSGEFTVLNERLVADLKARGLWDPAMLADLKHFDGSVAKIARVPDELRTLYATAFEIDAPWLIEAASRRQKWIDQAQSLNLYVAGASGRKLDEIYKLAWLRGLKTTYYLRTVSATSVEKSTGRGGELNAVQAAALPEADGQVCMMRPGDAGFEECTACQ
jgi:ribonucleoside-diphosphate reductase alpha chain